MQTKTIKPRTHAVRRATVNGWPGKLATCLNALLITLLVSVSTAQAENRDEAIFFLNDALGSAIAAVNEKGELCWSENYTPYGDKTINDDVFSPPNSGCGIVGEERGFTGHTEDVNSDLVYMQQRYYDPSMGRFLSIDPLDAVAGDPRTYNRYAYANNNPLSYIDPDGRDTVVIVKGYEIKSVGGYSFGHAYVEYSDTESDRTRISRGGPSSEYQGGSIGAALDKAYDNVFLSASDTPSSESYDYNKKGTKNIIDSETIPDSFDDVMRSLNSFNTSVNASNFGYHPRSFNSNSYAGTAFERIAKRKASNKSDGDGGTSYPAFENKVSIPGECGPNYDY